MENSASEIKSVTNLAIKFLKLHWDQINKQNVEITDNLKDFITKVKTDYELACWVLTEVISWGCFGGKHNFLEKYIIDTVDGELVIKLGRTYFKFENDRNSPNKYVFNKTRIKYKKLAYFE